MNNTIAWIMAAFVIVTIIVDLNALMLMRTNKKTYEQNGNNPRKGKVLGISRNIEISFRNDNCSRRVNRMFWFSGISQSNDPTQKRRNLHHYSLYMRSYCNSNGVSNKTRHQRRTAKI